MTEHKKKKLNVEYISRLFASEKSKLKSVYNTCSILSLITDSSTI